jgi:hypothetical protein
MSSLSPPTHDIFLKIEYLDIQGLVYYLNPWDIVDKNIFCENFFFCENIFFCENMFYSNGWYFPLFHPYKNNSMLRNSMAPLVALLN